MSAISFDGQGDGARIKLDIPRTDTEAILELQKLTEQVFLVEITPVEDETL